MGMLFFNPLLWYERINVNYDYDKDCSTFEGSRHDELVAYQRVYEFFKEPLCDGLLVSRTLVQDIATIFTDEDNRYKISDRANPTGYPTIQDYARIRGRRVGDNITFADPGTWSYANKFELPDFLYNVDELIRYYDTLGFDLAGSVDWPIVDRVAVYENGKKVLKDLDDKIKEERRQITIENAESFIKECRRRKRLNFVPFGTIQGYSLETYRDSLRRLLKLGYDYIAIGGLPSYSEAKVLELLPMIKDEIRRSDTKPGIHLYGRFPSPNAVSAFVNAGVTSFDNNTSFMAAAGKSLMTFFDPEFKESGDGVMAVDVCYGIKIPGRRSLILNRLRRIDKEGDVYEEVVELCDKTFERFVAYSNNPSPLNERIFMSYYAKMNVALNVARRRPHTPNVMKMTTNTGRIAVQKRAWLRCQCTSCKELKAHILLTRGNRIGHTFAHNTHVQYTRFQKEMKRCADLGVVPKYDWSPIKAMAKQKSKSLVNRTATVNKK